MEAGGTVQDHNKVVLAGRETCQKEVRSCADRDNGRTRRDRLWAAARCFLEGLSSMSETRVDVSWNSQRLSTRQGFAPGATFVKGFTGRP